MKALLLENIHPDGVRVLEDSGFEVRSHTGAMDENELIEALDGVDVVGIRSKTHITTKVLQARPNLMAIGAFCIGTNQIDVEAATCTGTAVFNAPYSNTRSVVEMAIAEIIVMARRLAEKNDNMHAGVWNKSATGSHEIRGRSLGIVGYGNIGSQLSVLAESCGMQVYFYDIVDRLALGNAKRCATLEELLATVDTVSLHVDGRATNTNMFGAQQFAQMKPRALFLNLCRGFVVDHEALRDALELGHIAGAAIDVFPEEPKAAGEPFASCLQGIPNVILTPHIGGSTQEAQQDIGHFVASKLSDYASNGSTTMSVNLPQVAVDSYVPGSRVLHLHHNIPGVMAKINQIFGDAGVNIDRQQLSTVGTLGYVVTDLARGLPRTAVDALLDLPETVRLSTIK